MQKWEYRTIKVETKGALGGVLDTAAMDGTLNQLGADGWEVVAAFTTNHGFGTSREAVVILKRPRG